MLTRRLVFLCGIYAAVIVVAWQVFVPPEDCGEVTPASLRENARAAASWIVANQLPDGSYTYEYDRDASETAADYNIVRHAGVTMSLYQAAGELNEPAFFAAADRGLAWMLDRLVERDGWTALADTPRAQLGSTALMTAALAQRRFYTGDTQYDDVLRGLGRFMVFLQRPDGGFHVAYQLDQDGPDAVGTSRYYPGEALWGLAQLENFFPDEDWDGPARRAARFISTLRDEVEDVEFRPLNDHWASYGFAEMAGWGVEDPEAEYARRLYGRFSLLVRFEAQRESGGLAALTHGPERRAAALGTWVEGLAALWRLSAVDPRLADLQDDIVDRAVCGAGVLDQRQASPEKAAEHDSPVLVEGAWFTDGETRMDDQQHAISGLLYTANALEAGNRE
jgi:hypothetical protein